MIELLGTAAVIGSGIVAGVFFAVAVSVLPAVQTLPADRYVELHRKLGEGYHPVMPLVVTVGVLADLALLVLADNGAVRVLFGAALVALIGVQVVSQFGNVPINKRVHAVDPAALPSGWQDPRPPWRAWHRLRTAFALAALAANALAVALLS
ncbi:anthrone oxygenase family protein [Streptomyces sp. NPDC088400]|uniref:anthrone oxygenase family protein n=1 Tax=Streptomyces sp. NPDC088400 TaxID=3365861 RepID=UPI0037F935BC